MTSKCSLQNFKIKYSKYEWSLKNERQLHGAPCLANIDLMWLIDGVYLFKHIDLCKPDDLQLWIHDSILDYVIISYESNLFKLFFRVHVITKNLILVITNCEAKLKFNRLTWMTLQWRTFLYVEPFGDRLFWGQVIYFKFVVDQHIIISSEEAFLGSYDNIEAFASELLEDLEEIHVYIVIWNFTLFSGS